MKSLSVCLTCDGTSFFRRRLGDSYCTVLYVIRRDRKLKSVVPFSHRFERLRGKPFKLKLSLVHSRQVAGHCKYDTVQYRAAL